MTRGGGGGGGKLVNDDIDEMSREGHLIYNIECIHQMMLLKESKKELHESQ